MTINKILENTKIIKKNQELLAGRQQNIYDAIPSKAILYGLLTLNIFIGMVGCFQSESIMVEQKQPTLYEKNVVGNEIPDKFYEINGEKAFVEIDGEKL